MTQKRNTFTLCISALMTAVICITTMIIQIPIPLGYAHLGNTFILLASAYLGRREAAFASGLGSSLADLLTGFTQWVIPTFFIKMITAFIVSRFIFDKNGNFQLFHIRSLFAVLLGMAWMTAGYTAAGCLLYGSIAAGIASAPGLIMEGIVGIAVYYVIAGVFEKAHLRHILQAE